MTSVVRLATVEDAESVREIYAPYVRDSAVSFEREVPSVKDIQERISGTLDYHPWLVVEQIGKVVGYAYSHSYRDRDAYQWSVESTVYVDEDHHRMGVACGLYTSLFETLRRQGFRSVYAAITLPNPASVGFHESMGFDRIGVYENVGFKLGSWHDVGWWSRSLGDYPDDPEPPVGIQEVRSRGELDDAFSAGQSVIRTTE